MQGINKQDIEFLLEQLRCIILNKPVPYPENWEEGDLSDVQEAISYLSDCLTESNVFLKQLAAGNLHATPPGRKNYLAGSLKELHAGLRHLTWQADRVARGDYNQTVSFLGDFSDSFNQMVMQLKEREEKLARQSRVLAQSNVLMQSIMDGLDEGILVLAQDDCKLIYQNEAAKQLLFGEKSSPCTCSEDCTWLRQHIEDLQRQEGQAAAEFFCPNSKRSFRVESVTMEWNGMLSRVNRIKNITLERREKVLIENLAYRDELTGLYNRRYCNEKMEEFLRLRTPFAFCMIDIDKLKHANDTFGHNAGDDYIKQVASRLDASTRSDDIVCRFGGDEFALIMLDCDASLITQKMEAINQKLQSADYPYPMSISYGAVAVSERNTLTASEIIKAADCEMYRVKRGH